MTTERWEQVKQLFHAALEQEAAQRPEFLARVCVDDAPLRDEVQSLLASHEQAESFIETPASDVAAGLLAEDHTGLVAGLMVNHFRIVDLLATGGMGEVYLADDMRLGRRVALKLLPTQFTINPERVRRFEQEARTASALNHPNIVTVYETGQFEDRNYIAVEFVEGQTLREHMANTGMKTSEVLDVAVQVAAALQAAHEAGIVHRDVKPENIMLRRDRIVKVVDFGLAKLATQQAEVEISSPTKSSVKTNPGMVIGTVGYMSPEQARGAEVDARTDIWSLGVVLYEMLSGCAPFQGETPSHVIVSILESEPPPLAPEPEAFAGLEHIVSKALRKEKSERYQTASEMAFDLKRLNEEHKVQSRIRAGGPDSTGGETGSGQDGRAAINTAHASPISTADLAFARTASSSEYLVNGIKRHKRSAVFASATVVLVVASVVYFSNFNKRNVDAMD